MIARSLTAIGLHGIDRSVSDGIWCLVAATFATVPLVLGEATAAARQLMKK